MANTAFMTLFSTIQKIKNRQQHGIDMQGSSEARCSSKSFWLCFSCFAKSTSNTEIRLLNVHSDSMDKGNLRNTSKVDVNGRSGSGDAFLVDKQLRQGLSI